MSFYLSDRSQRNLDGTHSDLRRLVYRALELSEIDFAVTEGQRTTQRQKELFASGASHTLNSRHILIETEDHGMVCHAIDVAAFVDGEISWSWPLYYKIAKAFYAAAHELGIKIEWGGEWDGDKKDGPHFQLPWKEYPIGSNTDSKNGL